jgi:hypothetical protein
MTQRALGPKGSRRRRWWLLSCLVVAIGLAAVCIPGALAVHDTGAFELDGNATNDPALAGDDWDNVCHQVTGSDCSTTNNTTGATAVDWVAEPNPNTTLFVGGGSKDPHDISDWAWKDASGGQPDKDDLQHSFAARYPNTSQGDILYFGSDRSDNSGDAQEGFWFFQNEIGLGNNSVGGGTGFTGVHKAGDVLVVTDFSNGGGTSTITVFSWDPTCTKTTGSTVGTCGDANLRIKGTSTAANCASAAAADQFCGIVNPSTITMPWSFTDKSGTPANGALNGEFFEGGVNLTALGLSGKCFASVAAESRASTSTTATLKDFILGNFGLCITEVHTTPSAASVSIGTGSVQVTDQATVTVSNASTWGGSVAFSLCGPSATACATDGTAIGSVNIDNTTTMPITSPAATVTSVGTYCWRADFTPDAASLANGVKPGSDDGATECFTVTPVTPQLGTTAGPSVTLGNPITDTATLTGTANKPGTPVINPTTPGGPADGTITFTLFGPNDCTTVAFTSSPVTVSGDGTYGPVSFTPTAAGTYHWAATYSGDPPNTNGTSHNLDCSDAGEDVVVTGVPSSMTSAQSFIPNDSATISATAGGALAGTVSFQVFASSDCSGTLIYSQNVSVSGASPQTVSTSNTTNSTTSANVSWLVSYDSTNGAQGDIPATCFEKTALDIQNDGTITGPNP